VWGFNWEQLTGLKIGILRRLCHFASGLGWEDSEDGALNTCPPVWFELLLAWQLGSVVTVHVPRDPEGILK
jgi:hypothetical protein